MIVAIADTHAAIWYLFSDSRLGEVSRQEIPELPDRVIAATALFYGVPVLSRDDRIRSSTIQSIW
jgi:PIN domain nuclease of toxin-antitoxin system